MTHPMMPQPSRDELARQLFILDLRAHLLAMTPTQREVVARKAAALAASSGREPGFEALRDALMREDPYRSWVALRRRSQEMLWEAIEASVDRQLTNLSTRARIDKPLGSLTLNPNLVVPEYLAAKDVHLMPGGYARDSGAGDVRQGAVMDRGGAIYMLGRSGGMMNDGRGHALVTHIFDRAPDFAPRSTLEFGCGVGASAVAVASYFPSAENCGIDVGASLLRYAHARAEHLGIALHLAQQNAEATEFPDDHFDLVYSCAVLHETSAVGVQRILSEARRILRPGGLMVHLEVPSRYDPGDMWQRLEGEFEQRYNNEPYWHGASTTDYASLLAALKFRDVMVGFQTTRPRAVRGNKGFSQNNSGVFACWFVMSATK